MSVSFIEKEQFGNTQVHYQVLHPYFFFFFFSFSFFCCSSSLKDQASSLPHSFFWGSCGEYKSLCFLLACLSFCSAVEIVIAKEVMDIIVAAWHGALYFFISFVVDSPAFRSLV
jgi:hypothetical protein